MILIYLWRWLASNSTRTVHRRSNPPRLLPPWASLQQENSPLSSDRITRWPTPLFHSMNTNTWQVAGRPSAFHNPVHTSDAKSIPFFEKTLWGPLPWNRTPNSMEPVAGEWAPGKLSYHTDWKAYSRIIITHFPKVRGYDLANLSWGSLSLYGTSSTIGYWAITMSQRVS